MKNRLLAGGVALAAVFGAGAADPYKVQAPMTADDEGAMAFIVNFDTGENVDSVLVADGVAKFSGEMDEPIVARLMVDGQRRGQFILEPGSIALDDKRGIAFGSPLNDSYNEIGEKAGALAQEFRSAQTEAEQEAIYNRYNALMDSAMRANLDNPIGYLLFVQQASDMEPAELEAFLEKEPSLKGYKRVMNVVEMNRRKAATSAGAKYLDFDIRGEKLSDYVGRDGKYLLVDFWASWCGPCRRQLPVLKELQAQYADKLNVLGVAVWDQADDTRRAIKEHELTWPCIIDAGNVPTDIYGISGIPCIMLIGPDGTILSRDLQGDELKAAVAAEMRK